jgi:ligand-binding sensor domain-containing protein
MTKQRSKDFTKHTSLLFEKDGSLWKTTRKILKIKTISFPIKKTDGSLAINDKEKAEAHGNTFPKFLNQMTTPFLL